FTIDDPTFVKHMCTFLTSHPSTEVALFYESKAGSIFDLQPKPSSRQTYSQCITPLAAPLPAWASAGTSGVAQSTLSLKPIPPSGSAPLTVRFEIAAKLSVPITHWEIVFGDGGTASGSGPPPATLPRPYRTEAISQALLFVFPAPPSDFTVAPSFPSPTVTVGTSPKARVSFAPTPTAGRAPLKVSFRVDLDLPAAVTRWTLVYG